MASDGESDTVSYRMNPAELLENPLGLFLTTIILSHNPLYQLPSQISHHCAKILVSQFANQVHQLLRVGVGSLFNKFTVFARIKMQKHYLQ